MSALSDRRAALQQQWADRGQPRLPSLEVFGFCNRLLGAADQGDGLFESRCALNAGHVGGCSGEWISVHPSMVRDVTVGDALA